MPASLGSILIYLNQLRKWILLTSCVAWEGCHIHPIKKKSENECSLSDRWIAVSADILHCLKWKWTDLAARSPFSVGVTLPPLTTLLPVIRPVWWTTEQSLGIKYGFCCNPVSDWILAGIPCSILSSRFWDAKCSRWQLCRPAMVIQSPLNDLWAWKDNAGSSLKSGAWICSSTVCLVWSDEGFMHVSWSLGLREEAWVCRMARTVWVKLWGAAARI